jgi:Na+/melibiose symporter-like transporter
LFPAILSDFVQYDAIKNGRSSAGMFMGINSILIIIPATLVNVIAGSMIYLRSVDKSPTAFGTLAVAVIAVITAVIAIFFVARLDLRDLEETISKAGLKNDQAVSKQA